jgi:FKBP-type peptidyl-prolyl cis-trans isomerase
MKQLFETLSRRQAWVLVAMLLMAGVVMTSGCNKDNGCNEKSVESEDAAMQAFMQANGINGTKHSRGFYYEIISPGSNTRPIQASIIYCTYKGTLFDGSVFDEQTNPGNTGFRLNAVIEGWQLGIPLIGKGGRIKLVLPSAYGYGCEGAGDDIPANSPLYFEVNLVDFFN